MNEIWRDIEGYENLYQISNLGRVKSLYRVMIRSDKKKHTVKERILKSQIEHTGYEVVKLSKNTITKTVKVHRLVATAFIPNLDNKPQVNHINCIKNYNIVENLEWVTNLENQQHARKNGLIPKLVKTQLQIEAFREMARNQVINVNQYDLNGNYIQLWKSAREAERMLKINNANITAVCKQKRNQAGGYVWRYAKTN